MLAWHVATAVLGVRYVFRDPRMDLRFVILGALLPDLIDKPVGTILFAGTFETSRIYGHTLLFPLVILTVVMLITDRGASARKSWLGVPIGVLIHLIVDGVWLDPVTFWWPLFGWEFPPLRADYWSGLVAELLSSPLLWIQEAAGVAYLVYLWRKAGLGREGRWRAFLRTGRLEPIEATGR